MALLVLGAQAAWGFALLGPDAQYGGNPAGFGDSWQTETIGFDPNTELDNGESTGPKNIGEGYRQNKPVLFYAYDANFLGFFGSGSNGVEPVDQAFAIMNAVFTNNPTGMTNGLDGYSSALVEFPPYSQHINYKAQELELTDIKSLTLWALVEQMGLAWPERYTWTLHQAYLPPTVAPAPAPVCPEDEVFEVVQRNFDIMDSPLNQVQYSPYVNDTLYTFNILYWPNCKKPTTESFDFITGDASIVLGKNPSLTDTEAYTPFPVDPFAQYDSAVAATLGLQTGGFYTGLTRDDVAGLRYLMTTNNVNTEDAAAGALLLVTNTLPNVTNTLSDLNLLLQRAAVSDPATLQGFYPGLTFTYITTNLVAQVTTNITIFYTNQPYLAGPATNGTTVTNFGFPPQFLVTGDFGLLLQRAATNDPATLQALYPGLLVTTVTNFAVCRPCQTTVLAYTNQPGPYVTNYPATLYYQRHLDFGLLFRGHRWTTRRRCRRCIPVCCSRRDQSEPRSSQRTSGLLHEPALHPWNE